MGDDKASNAGEAYIFFGSDSMAVTSTYDVYFPYPGTDSTASFGISAYSGDVNGDGYSDVVVAGWGSNIKCTDCGGAWLYYGSSSISGTVDPDAYFEYRGTDDGELSGGSIGIGDANGDGYDDITMGARYSDIKCTECGASYLYYGSPTLSGTTTYDVYQEYPGAVSLRLYGYGHSLGDINGDGYDDTVIGGNDFDTTGGVWSFYGGKSISYPTFYFAEKLSSFDRIDTSWDGQSSIAASEKNIKMDVYNFNTTSWQNRATNSSCAVSTDCTLTDAITSSTSNYYDANNWTYWRVYQENGNSNLETDYYYTSGPAAVTDITVS